MEGACQNCTFVDDWEGEVLNCWRLHFCHIIMCKGEVINVFFEWPFTFRYSFVKVSLHRTIFVKQLIKAAFVCKNGKFKFLFLGIQYCTKIWLWIAFVTSLKLQHFTFFAILHACSVNSILCKKVAHVVETLGKKYTDAVGSLYIANLEDDISDPSCCICLF